MWYAALKFSLTIAWNCPMQWIYCWCMSGADISGSSGLQAESASSISSRGVPGGHAYPSADAICRSWQLLQADGEPCDHPRWRWPLSSGHGFQQNCELPSLISIYSCLMLAYALWFFNVFIVLCGCFVWMMIWKCTYQNQWGIFICFCHFVESFCN